MSVYTYNAAAFATTQASALDQERNAASIAGLGTLDVAPACPCGGRCGR